jgi:hypothetical protein
MIWNHSSGQDYIQSALWWPRWHISRLYMSYWLDFGDSLCVCHNTMHNCIVHTLSGIGHVFMGDSPTAAKRIA